MARSKFALSRTRGFPICAYNVLIDVSQCTTGPISAGEDNTLRVAALYCITYLPFE